MRFVGTCRPEKVEKCVLGYICVSPPKGVQHLGTAQQEEECAASMGEKTSVLECKKGFDYSTKMYFMRC